MPKALLRLAVFTTVFFSTALRAETLFLDAKPVWPAGQDTTMNLSVGFRARLDNPPTGPVYLKIAGCSEYRFFVNGKFAGHGPSRGPHGWFRVDEWDFAGQLNPGKNILAIEVTGYNINSYYLLDQTPFLQAEVLSGGKVLAATGGPGSAFEAALLPERVRQVRRYSFQRTFLEYYRLNSGSRTWRTAPATAFARVELAVQPGKTLLPGGVTLPDFQLRQPVEVHSVGTFEVGDLPDSVWTDRALTLVGSQIKGFRKEELEVAPSVELQRVKTLRNDSLGRPYSPDSALDIRAGGFAILDLGTNLTGFPGLRVKCSEKTRLYFAFDEILVGGDIDFKRGETVNLAGWELEPGEYWLETLEPYTLRYLKVLVMQGGLSADKAYLREYANPESGRAHFAASDPRLNTLFEAARQTFRQNAVDLFTDCPSRERAGWLCDSYFTARAGFTLCGDTRVEKNFMQNFILPDSFPKLPAGMLPMCYPADNHNGSYIPNWAMWFVLQLEEYAARSGDRAMVEAARDKVTGLLKFFEKYRNSDGLLEKLDSWVFVEWSEANDFVQDVNYPSNMLYAAALDAAARMYGIKEYAEEAEKVRAEVRRQSYDGTFFVDNAVRKNGKLTPTRNRTETCQYYAFYLGTATPQIYPELWRRLVKDFGPKRQATHAWPEVYFSRPFIGNVLRLEVLSRAGLVAQALEESRDYLLYMAERTGTLWEFHDIRASCDHGFGSHTAHFLVRDILGFERIDPVGKKISLRLSDPGIEWCEGRIPSPDGEVYLRWWKEGGGIKYQVQVPAGYNLSVQNNTGGTISPAF